MAPFTQQGSLEAVLANGYRLLNEKPGAAAQQAREILSKQPRNRPAMRLLGTALRRLGHEDEASQHEPKAIEAASGEHALVATAQAISDGDFKRAEQTVRAYLAQFPDDPAALRLLAEIAAKAGHPDRAADLLEQALELAPNYESAHIKLAHVLFIQGKFEPALEQLDRFLRIDPGHLSANLSKAATLIMIGEFEAAAGLYQRLTESHPSNSEAWLSYAHTLNTIGRRDESVAAYRNAIALQPSQGDAWWAIANLKLQRFNEDDVSAMLTALDDRRADDASRLHLHFALGKALEDLGDYETSFSHYASGNRIRAEQLVYDPADTDRLVDLTAATFDAEFFASRSGAGTSDRDPIFVLGMPRSGSTLVEQILASHPSDRGDRRTPLYPHITRPHRGNRSRALRKTLHSTVR
jgi:tetratricopeptide (TPR) repeat protein